MNSNVQIIRGGLNIHIQINLYLTSSNIESWNYDIDLWTNVFFYGYCWFHQAESRRHIDR